MFVTNATSGVVTSNTWPTAVEFNAGSLANSVTVLMRLRADTFNAFLGNGEYSWVVNNGEHWGTAGGSTFGFNPNKTIGERSAPLCMMFGKQNFASPRRSRTSTRSAGCCA